MIRKKVFLYVQNLLLIIILAIFVAEICKTFLFQFYMIPTDSMKEVLLPGDGILVSKVHYKNRIYNTSIPGFSSIKENDIIVFKQPGEKNETLIKRCIGLPGDTLIIKNHQAYTTGNKKRAIIKGTKKPKTERLIYRGELKFPRFSSSKKKANYGPVIVPQNGLLIAIDISNISLYKNVIEKYEGNKVQIINNHIVINGKQVDHYRFKKNYYFMMGDNRQHSADSRFWGFLPEDFIIGKAIIKVFSSDPDQGISSIKLNSLFKYIY